MCVKYSNIDNEDVFLYIMSNWIVCILIIIFVCVELILIVRWLCVLNNIIFNILMVIIWRPASCMPWYGIGRICHKKLLYSSYFLLLLFPLVLGRGLGLDLMVGLSLGLEIGQGLGVCPGLGLVFVFVFTTIFCLLFYFFLFLLTINIPLSVVCVCKLVIETNAKKCISCRI